MILTVTPNPSVDRTLDVGEFRFGEVNRARDVRVEPSGKGVNVSRALTVNGVPSLAVLPAGGAEGSQLLALLRAEGVPHRAVRVAGATRVNLSVRSGGQVTKLNEPGPVLTAEEGTALLDAIGAAAREARPAGGSAGRTGPVTWLVGAGTLPGGLPAAFYSKAMDRAARAEVRFALDSSGDALRNGLDARPSLVKPNLTELEQLAGHRLPTLGAVMDASRHICQLTGGAVLVSLGRLGAVLADDEGTLLAWSAALPGANPVGAGDSLLAGFLSGLTSGMARSAALREGVAWATVAVRAFGSVGRAVTERDRAAVRLDPDPDPARPSV